MSNYKDKNITLSKVLFDWYKENQKENEINHKTYPIYYDYFKEYLNDY